MTENDFTEISVSTDLQTKNEVKNRHKDALLSKNHVQNMMFQNLMILAEEVKLQLLSIQISREITSFKDQRQDLPLHNELNHSIDQEAMLQVNKETINLINQGQNELDHSIDPKWILPNRNLNLDHLEVWENQMEEPKINFNKKTLFTGSVFLLIRYLFVCLCLVVEQCLDS